MEVSVEGYGETLGKESGKAENKHKNTFEGEEAEQGSQYSSGLRISFLEIRR